MKRSRSSPLVLLLGIAVFLIACAREQEWQPLDQADRVVIVKSTHSLTLMNGTKVLKAYRVALGRNPVGPKTHKGDHKTPEGEYVIDAKKANSRFYRALHISYPSVWPASGKS